MTKEITKKRPGRPPGAKNRKTLLKQEMELLALETLHGMALDALNALHKNAQEGDTAAAKVLVDKFLPNAQPGGENDKSTPMVNINIAPATPTQPATINVTPAPTEEEHE